RPGSPHVYPCGDRKDGGCVQTRANEAIDLNMGDESAEIFDDLYLGLRAGGALRKQRRGEELTREEEEALGRWQRLSTVRKVVAIGGFAVGTFGLGFTLGGLVFGRWRKGAVGAGARSGESEGGTFSFGRAW